MFFLIILHLLVFNTSPIHTSLDCFDGETTTQFPSTTEPCGEYGFRCIDSKTFQICALIDMDGNIDDPDDFHECANGTNCDEDNPAYCTPIQYEFLSNENHNFNEDEREPREINYDEDVITEMIETTTSIVTTTITSEDDDESCTDSSVDQPNFDCESLGFFPDSTSKNLFWFCDVKNNGNGFKARHMKCGLDRIFDSVKKECVLIGTTRLIRDREEFSCFNRKPGKYYDSRDCRNYYYCLPSIFGPFNKFEMKCPEETGYDRRIEKCNKNGLKRCEEDFI